MLGGRIGRLPGFYLGHHWVDGTNYYNRGEEKAGWGEGREMIRPILDMLTFKYQWNIQVEISLM